MDQTVHFCGTISRSEMLIYLLQYRTFRTVIQVKGLALITWGEIILYFVPKIFFQHLYNKTHIKRLVPKMKTNQSRLWSIWFILPSEQTFDLHNCFLPLLDYHDLLFYECMCPVPKDVRNCLTLCSMFYYWLWKSYTSLCLVNTCLYGILYLSFTCCVLYLL